MDRPRQKKNDRDGEGDEYEHQERKDQRERAQMTFSLGEGKLPSQVQGMRSLDDSFGHSRAGGGLRPLPNGSY